MKIKYISVLLLALLFTGLTAPAQTWLWGVQGGNTLKADVYAGNVATNRTGNVYQTGGFETSITFGTYNFNSVAEEDVFLVKYDQNGNVLWASQSVGNGDSYAIGYSVATDDLDNSYITGIAYNVGGYEWDTLAFGPKTLYVNNQFIVKYDPNGNVVWATQPDTTIIFTGMGGSAVTTDKFNHEYVTGDGAFLIKYDRNGNVIWTVPQTIDSFEYNTGYSVATDISGNIYMSGTFIDSLQFGTFQLYSLNGGIFTAKFDSNGHALWAQQSSNDDYYHYYYGVSVAVDKSGAAYITSPFSDTIAFGAYTFINDSTSSFFVLKYNPNGTIAWGKETVPVNGSYCGSYSICSDDSNHIYISGGEDNYASQNASFEFANYTVIFNTYFDSLYYDVPSFLLKLDSFGNVICGSTLPVGAAEPNAVTSDSTGKFVYMGGIFLSSFALGSDSLIDNTGGSDTYVGRWKSCGECDLPVTISPQAPFFCSGQSDTLTASGGTSYTWSPETGLSATTGGSVLASPTITVTYTVTSTNSGGCVSTGTDIVTVLPSPNKPSFAQHRDTLISSSVHDNQWYRDDTLLQNDTSQYLKITILGQYWVNVLNEANGCSTTSDTMNITSLTGINQLTVKDSGQFIPILQVVKFSSI